jgi:dolichol-phosphate mannosyltransferase
VSILVVGHRLQPLDVRTRAGGRSCEEHRVRLVDLPRRELLAGPAELGARAEDREPGSPRARHLRRTGGGGRAEMSSGEDGARREHRVARAHVAADRAHIRALLYRLRELDAVSSVDNKLDRHDRVRAVGHDAAGRDPHRLPRQELSVGGTAGGDPQSDIQRAGRVCGPHREAVHRGAPERRQIDLRAHIACEHPARRGRERHLLGRQRPHALEHEGERLLDRQQPAHRAHTLVTRAAPGGYARPVISVVIPVHNEERSVALLLDEIGSALQPLGQPWEAVFVDDGSEDGTFGALTRLHAAANNVRVVRLRRNFGKAAALQAGFEAATGDVVVTIDGDLQDDPAEIPRLLAKLDEGFDLVSGWKTRRRDPLSRRLPSRIFNVVTGRLSGLRLHDLNCGLKAYRAEVVRGLRIYGELHRFIPVLAHYRGFRVAELPVNHRPREHGRSRYGMERYLRGFLDLLTVTFMGRYRHRPLHLFGGLGLALGGAGSLVLLYLAAVKLSGEAIGHRPLLTLGVLLVVVGMQFLSLGLLSELITSHHEERSDVRRSAEQHVDEILR